MHRFWEKVEHYNAMLIPYALIILFGIIIFELFLHIEDENILFFVHVLDGIVITIFVIDLIFLRRKAKTTKEFMKHYWLDIIAVFPFVFLFNQFGRIYRAIVVNEQFAVGQAILHEGLEAEKGIKIAARGEKALKFTRVARIIRIVARALRFVTKTRLLSRFSHWFSKKK